MTTSSKPTAAARFAALLVRAYQVTLSPLLGKNCRYQPTCSEYTRQAIERHGAARGIGMGIRRLGRCHPFRDGGFDPVPGHEEEAG